MIPKRGRPGKWRLIVNLSAPRGRSVNDGISKELASLSYVSVDEVAMAVLQLGQGTMLAKMDVKQAYRNIPVHPEDRPLLGMQWEGETFVDAALPFGLRSAPLMFTVVADALQWIMEQRGVALAFHYIDDFITLGAPGSNECQKNSDVMHEICKEVGMPIEPEKDEGPATTITFTGIELDSVALELRLPQEKLRKLKSELAGWRGRKACRKQELLSLVGSLSHACKVVRAGRTFIRRLSVTAERLKDRVRLNTEARSDIEWWARFCEAWNGTAMMWGPKEASASVEMTSDASGEWGCGAFWGNEWFMLPWAGPISRCHITVKELVPVVIAAAVWGRRWRGKTVRVWSDNAATVSIVNRGTSHEKKAMHLARCLAFMKAKGEFELVASHIRGTDNSKADALSRNNLTKFRCLHPQAAHEPVDIPMALLDLLLVSKPDWTSRRWSTLWNSIFQME